MDPRRLVDILAVLCRWLRTRDVGMGATVVKDVTLLIDGDPLVYACGFVAERRRHMLEWYDNDRLRIATFDAAWRRDVFIEMMALHPDEYATTLYSTPYEFGHAVQALRTTLGGIEDNVHAYLHALGLAPGRTEIFLTGDQNFRPTVATIRPYKGNRTSGRPYWYEKLREHMVTRLGATVVNGMEADDAIAMRQWRNVGEELPSTIICTIDKDLDMVPGLHYHPKNKEAWHQTAEGALVSFYRQLLTGDAVDNIPGCKGIGRVAARRMIDSGMTEPRMYETCLRAYEANLAKYPEHHAPHTDAASSLWENAQLLWMLRYPGDFWKVPQ